MILILMTVLKSLVCHFYQKFKNGLVNDLVGSLNQLMVVMKIFIFKIHQLEVHTCNLKNEDTKEKA